jgi:hypothetical protein
MSLSAWFKFGVEVLHFYGGVAYGRCLKIDALEGVLKGITIIWLVFSTLFVRV